MDAGIASASNLPNLLHRLLPVLGPVLLVAIGYVDPGKWAATVEGGAHFGHDLIVLMLVFNFAAMLCQYLSARIAIVTGRDLAQICSDEYDKYTCMFIGVQAELSVILMDISMILGMGHGLNLLFGLELFTCVFLTAAGAILYPLSATFLDSSKAKYLCVGIAGFILLSYFLGVVTSQPEIPISINGMLTKVTGESAFTLMSLLGASIMPHNFYLHSAIVKQRPPNVATGALFHHHFFSILSVYSGIYLVNYVLMNSAANGFYGTGLGLLTFQDALSVMDQVFSSPAAPLAFLLLLCFADQTTSLTWNLVGGLVVNDFFGLDIPAWLHRATIRIIAIVSALLCVWFSGAEGVYQLLISSQVMVALLLPSSVIPLFRVATSRSIMGAFKISQITEFLALITFIGILGLNIIFVVEMMLGNSDWVSSLSTSALYVGLLIIACASLCLMLWLAATPLKSATSQMDDQVWNWNIQKDVAEENNLKEPQYLVEEPVQKLEPLPVLETCSDITASKAYIKLPETVLEADWEVHKTSFEENRFHLPQPHASTVQSAPSSTVESTDGELLETRTVQAEQVKPVEKKAEVERDLKTGKDYEGDTWEPVEVSKEISARSPSLTCDGPSLTCDGPGSFKSLGGKGDEVGSGIGSLSRLAGLGRAARRQLAAALDEFWGQLYDFHGQATNEAKAKKLDILLGTDSNSKSTASPQKVDIAGKEVTGSYTPLVGGRVTDYPVDARLYDPSNLQRGQSNIESSFGVQRGSSTMLSNHMQLLDAYVQNSSHNVLDAMERRYSSMRVPPSSGSLDYQPATMHGYQMASSSPMSYRDPYTYAMAQMIQNGSSSVHASGFQNLSVSRNHQQQSERPERQFTDSISSVPGDSVASTKKYHSLPSISGLSVPQRDQYKAEKVSRWGMVPPGFESSVAGRKYEQSMYSNIGLKAGAGAPVLFDELSPSNAYSPRLNSRTNTGSPWSRQPFEQFGVRSEITGGRSSPMAHEIPVDAAAKLMKSFRTCIMKLLKLEGSDWLFKQNDGSDEDLIERVTARERFLLEAETRETGRVVAHSGSPLKHDEMGFSGSLVSSVPNCGEGCVWRPELIKSFGVWCIHRILDLSLMESRPELWGKYTYVLNRLQGIIDVSFSKPRTPMSPCFCLQIPIEHQKSSPPISNGMLPPAAKPGRGKCTNAASLLEMIKDVELAISYRKGRTGTAAGDVAFPKGKENLASVLKRYKRRLSNKSGGA